MNLQTMYGISFIQMLGFNRPGKIFFVSNVTTNAVINYIQNAIKPDSDGVIRFHTTITSALAKCVASRGDTIYVLPGHTESVASAGALAINVAGVSIIGLGTGSIRPTITFTTATTATCTMSAANCTLENFNVTSTFDAVVSPFVVSAANCAIRGCSFTTADATYQVTQMILTTVGANKLIIENNRFVGTVDAGNTCAISLVGGDGIIIRNNYIHGAYTTTVGGIQCISTLTTNIEISGNIIINRTASSAKAITLLTGSTGMISDNRMGILTGTAPVGSDAAYWSGNYYAAAVATAGTLL